MAGKQKKSGFLTGTDFPYYRALWNRIFAMMLIPAVAVTSAVSGFFCFSRQGSMGPVTAAIIYGVGILLIIIVSLVTANALIRRLEAKRSSIYLLDQQMIKISRLAVSARLSRDYLHHIKDLLANIDAAAACAEGFDAKQPLETVRENLVQIREAAKSGHAAIDTFLDFTRPPGESWLIREIDIHSVLDELIHIFEDAFTAKQIRVQRRYADSRLTLRSNPSRLNQVFQNLFLSIVGDVSGATDVEIHTAVRENRVEITVSYPSINFNAEVIDDIADPLKSVQTFEPGAWLALCVYTVGRIKGGIRSGQADRGRLAITISLPMRLGATETAG